MSRDVLPLVGMPQGAEWLIIMALLAVVVVPIALVIWLIVKLATR